MLYIGGTRDRQREHVPFNGNRCVLPIKRESESYSRQSLLSTPLPAQTEIYGRKEIWKKGRRMFSVMVKDGSNDLLSAFVADYNKKNGMGEGINANLYMGMF